MKCRVPVACTKKYLRRKTNEIPTNCQIVFTSVKYQLYGKDTNFSTDESRSYSWSMSFYALKTPHFNDSLWFSRFQDLAILRFKNYRF